MKMSNHPDGERGHSFGKCDACQTEVHRYRGEADISCPNCDAQYNCFGQRLRDDWRGNMSNYDDEISDMEGFERQQLSAEQDY